MSPSRAGTLTWWSTRVAVPILALGATAVLIGRSSFDRASLVPFFDAATQTFPLRRDWFFENVLHIGGKWAVIACTAALIVGAAFGWRNEARSRNARRFAYLAACLLVTVGITGTWKDLADQVTPWDTIGFGGKKPWPGSPGHETPWDLIGSPGAHASSGFAWVSLYFVGASLGTRHRWLWLAPGLLLGLLFALGQHARGAHQPSHEPWSVVVAWSTACALAVVFRKLGWLAWNEVDPAAEARPATREPAIPWLVGSSVAFLGVAFFGTDLFTEQMESQFPGLHRTFEFAELAITALGFGVAAWLLAEKIQSMRASEARRLEEERERRFQVLGRMAASVAHEVRNPLQTVRLIVDEQRHEVAGLRDHPLQAEFESSLERIDRAVDLVYRLARPESGEVELTDLAQAVRESVVALSRVAPGRVSFEWEREPQRAIVASPRSALRIVIDNLLRNAAEASPAGGRVLLELGQQQGDWVLSIQNPGSLSAPRPADGREPGLGLGVPISRQIASNAGGGIDMAEAGGQVTCTLRWPRAVEPAA
ncbi:MAG: hypothetical protein NTY35_05000 [Planctomycetota bacterium]|nr:hypothetical protein [Planctomycetota bacterium]